MKHHRSINKFFFLGISISILLYGCSTQNKFASSFGKRRYTKGFYVDVPGAVKTVNGKAIHKRAAKVLVELPFRSVNTVAIKENNEVKPAGINYTAAKISAQHKTAVHKVQYAPVKVSAINGDEKPASDKYKERSPFSFASLMVFLAAAVVLVIAAIVAIAVSANFVAAATILYIGFIAAAAIDVVSVFLALLAFERKETYLNEAKLVLIVNGLALLIFLVAWARQVFK